MVAEVKSRALQKRAGGWRLSLEEGSVSRSTVDHAFALEFHAGEQSAVVRIEGAFTILDHGRAYQLTPSLPLELGPAVALFGQVVRYATRRKTGSFKIAFEDGRLSVSPDARYESWEISGPGGMRAVCAPGGALSVWQPKDAPES